MLPTMSLLNTHCPTNMLPWKPQVAPYSPFILLLHPLISYFIDLFIHPFTLLINNDGRKILSKQGHLRLWGCHRNWCWPPLMSLSSLYPICPAIISPPHCTTKIKWQAQSKWPTCQSHSHFDYTTTIGRLSPWILSSHFCSSASHVTRDTERCLWEMERK